MKNESQATCKRDHQAARLFAPFVGWTSLINIFGFTTMSQELKFVLLMLICRLCIFKLQSSCLGLLKRSGAVLQLSNADVSIYLKAQLSSEHPQKSLQAPTEHAVVLSAAAPSTQPHEPSGSNRNHWVHIFRPILFEFYICFSSCPGSFVIAYKNRSQN